MEKIKIFKLAQELDKSSKEIVTFLQEKGIEAKAANSSVDEAAAELVRNKFVPGGGKPAQSTELKSAESKEPKKEVKATEDRPAEGSKTTDNKPAASQATGEQAKKKKKNMSILNNPQNSNISGQRRSGEGQYSQGTNQRQQNAGGNRPQQQNTGRNRNQNAYGNNQRPGQNRTQNTYTKEVPHKIIRPLTVPSVPESTQAEKKRIIQGDRLGQQKMQSGINAENKNSTYNKQPANAGENLGVPNEVKRAETVDIRSGNDKNQGNGGNRPAYDRNQGNTGNRPSNDRNQGNTGNRPSYGNQGNTGSRPSYDRNQGNTGSRPSYGNQGNTGSRPSYGNQGNTGNRPSYGNQGNTGNRPSYGNQGNTGNKSASDRPQGNADRRNQRPYGTDNKNNNTQRFGGGNAGTFQDKDRDRSSSIPAQARKTTSRKGFSGNTPAKDGGKYDDKRRVGQDKDRKSSKNFIFEDENAKNKNKAGRFIKPEKKIEEVKEEQIKVIEVPDTLTIKELADKMKMQPSVIIKKLFLKGQIVTVNTDISFEEAENIAIEYEIMCEKEVQIDVIEELLKEDDDKEAELTARAPVICVMGHVDHGKTSLLDAIRKTNVIDREAGGITQHIGAYTVKVRDQKITFLDTPGHEAFTAMRMRGANATDIAILVVAADDGVMPQTVEAINHAKAAGIEIIIAVNKMDKPGANIDRVKQEMTEYELIPADWGGSTEYVPVSAKSGEGIDDLLETILITSEIMELKSNANRRARGLVIEAELDKGRGAVATVLVQKGTLHVGDFISAGASHGKVRAMIDDKGRRVNEALPSTPVEILGLSDVPSAGEVFIAHENDKTAKNYAETYLAQNKVRMLEDTKAKMSLDDLFTQIQAGNLKELNIIVKADVQGSVEAVKQSLMKLSNEEVVVKCIHGGVGAINESDVSLAATSSAIIIGFNVRPDVTAKSIAEREGVDIKLYKVIYQAIEDIEAAMKGMLDPVYEEKVIGHAEVRQIFKASAIGNIAGSYVLDGVFQRGSMVRIKREGNQVFEGDLKSLKRFKDDVKEVKAGYECGLVFDGYDQMQELDIVEAYIMVEVPR